MKRTLRGLAAATGLIAALALAGAPLAGATANPEAEAAGEIESGAGDTAGDLEVREGSGGEGETPTPLAEPTVVDEESAPTLTRALAAVTPASCQADILALVNTERKAAGLNALVLDANLSSLSQMWADWMATTGIVEHLPYLYPDAWDLWEAVGNRPGGENIAAGQPTAAIAMDGWMNSPGHRANILKSDFTRMGVGCTTTTTGYKFYWVQQFSYGTMTPITSHDRLPLPTSQLSPQITGQRTVGQTLSVALNGSMPTGTTLKYQWTANGQAIPGATGTTFSLTADQAGKRMGVTVTATNNPIFYAATTIPVPTDTQTVAGGATGQLKAPSVSISGTATVGSKLSVVNGAASNFTPAADAVTYQWLRNGSAISSATGSTYTLVAADGGKQISVRVTGTKAGYTSASATSSAVSVPAPVSGVKVQRYAGSTRYGTNLAVNKATITSGKPVFIATGRDYPDALSIGPAVALTGGSLFLTNSGGLDQASLQLITANHPSTVYVVGGTGAVSDAVVSQLRSATGKTPVRVGGSTRYQTSANIFTTFFQGRTVTTALVATGRDYPDALSAASAGGALGAPVLLVDGTKPAGLSAQVTQDLKNKGVTKVLIAGGTGAVNSTIEQNLKSSFGSTAVTRLSGSTRYGTNLAVNNYVTSVSAGTAMTNVWVATGTNFPDALSAAAPAGQLTGRLVLSNGQCLMKPVVSQWITGSTSKVSTVNLVGGSGVLSQSVANLTECK